jgi:hypothetical protein
MDLLESHTHSFIVRIWREQVTEGERPPAWRGHVTHVPGGERHDVQTLDDIALCIIPHLEAIGVRPTLRWRIRRWLKQRKQP